MRIQRKLKLTFNYYAYSKKWSMWSKNNNTAYQSLSFNYYRTTTSEERKGYTLKRHHKVVCSLLQQREKPENVWIYIWMRKHSRSGPHYIAKTTQLHLLRVFNFLCRTVISFTNKRTQTHNSSFHSHFFSGAHGWIFGTRQRKTINKKHCADMYQITFKKETESNGHISRRMRF